MISRTSIPTAGMNSAKSTIHKKEENGAKTDDRFDKDHPEVLA